VVVVYFFDPSLTTAMTEALFSEEGPRGGGSERPRGRSHDDRDLDRQGAQGRGDLQGRGEVDWNLVFDGRGIDGKLARLFDVAGVCRP
jgi:hypothetical protein